MNDLDTMVKAYIEAIYFTETGDSEQPPADAELSALDKAEAYLDCRNFYQAAIEELGCEPRDIDWSQAGHDLWLTRNGHGTGFWDRSDETYGDCNGTPLKTLFCALAKAMGEHDATFEVDSLPGGARRMIIANTSSNWNGATTIKAYRNMRLRGVTRLNAARVLAQVWLLGSASLKLPSGRSVSFWRRKK